MNLTNSATVVNLDSYEENGEWEIYRTESKRNVSVQNRPLLKERVKDKKSIEKKRCDKIKCQESIKSKSQKKIKNQFNN